jgi:hypothetical protein
MCVCDLETSKRGGLCQIPAVAPHKMLSPEHHAYLPSHTEMVGVLRQLRNQEIYNFFLPDVISTIQSNIMEWVWHAAGMGKTKHRGTKKIS